MSLMVEIPDDLANEVARIGKRSHSSSEAVVLRAVSSLVRAENTAAGHLTELENTQEQARTWRDYFGAMKGFPEDGQAFQERIRREWDRELD